MINRHTLSIHRKRNLMNTITTLQQYTKDRSSLISVLKGIVQQVSPFDSTCNPETYNKTLSLLTYHLSKFLVQSYEREDLLKGSSFVLDDFSCQQCCELLYQPVTMQCGHTFCFNCIADHEIKQCLVCGKCIDEMDKQNYRTNVTLSNICKKWCSFESMGRSLVIKGLLLFRQSQYLEAIEVFTNALSFVPVSHVSYLHRAEAYLLIGNYKDALKDAKKAVSLAPKWSKAHFVKAEILFRQHSLEDALFSCLLALVLNPNHSSIPQRVKTIIQELLSSNEGEVSPTGEGSPRKIAKRSRSDHLASEAKMQIQGSNSNYRTGLLLNYVHITQPVTTKELSLEESDTLVSSLSSVTLQRRITDATELHPIYSLIDAATIEQKDIKPNAFLTDDVEKSLEKAFFFHLRFNGDFSLKNKESENYRKIEASVASASDFECSLCMRLFYDPVTTPCGHTFCQSCIERCFDHRPQCPLCKRSVQDYFAKSLAEGHPSCDYAINSIIKSYFPKQYKERKDQHLEEITELNELQPLFVCTLAFPLVPCPLHIFEPRYRLMLRRCLEFNERAFGMCMPGGRESDRPTEIGTLLKVRDVTYFPDGRSVVDSIGHRRFRTSHSRLKDGYNVAKLNYIVDCKIEDIEETSKLCTQVYNDSRSWYDALDDKVKERISQHYEGFPVKDNNLQTENGPDWHWWVLAMLPVEEKIKVTILGKDSLHERLLILQRIFTCLKRRKAMQ